MLVALAELRDAGTARDYTLLLPAEDIELQGDGFTVTKPPEVRLQLFADDGGVTVTGTISARLKVECARCLVPTEFSIDAQVNDTWTLNLEAEEGDEFFDSAFISEDRKFIDLSEYALELLHEQLPLRVVCQADCKGLCFNCGENLNEAKCGCNKKDIDPRLAVLGRLLSNKGGVRDGGS